MTPFLWLAAVLVVFVLVALVIIKYVMRPYTRRQEEIAKAAGPIQYAPCPKCGSVQAAPVSWAWWGGVLGPRMLRHVKCASCGTAYNGKTGKPNAVLIAVYTVVGFAVAYGFFSLLGRLRQ